MKKYKKGNGHHLTLSDRTYIEQELTQGNNFKSISEFLEKDLSTISKEVKLSSKFRFEGMYRVFIRSVAPIFVVVILLSSILSVLGILNI